MKTEIGGREYESPATIILGKDLKRMRISAKITTSIAAEYMGIRSRKTIENWESGASSPSMNQLILLCMYYDFDASKVIAQCVARIQQVDPQEDYRDIDLDACVKS